MNDAITLDGVGKSYRQSLDGGGLLSTMGRRLRRRDAARTIWALRDIDLAVPAGQTIGVIGRNGSGKTTLLRLLAGVSAPSVGSLTVRGSIAPLIGVGVGFNGELTGRENVEANGQILGMTPRQVDELYEQIVDFSEIRDFIDSPVKFYSSGMFLRLAFSVAIHLRPDVMLVDEILAVGDVAFQLKCFDRMAELQEAGTTFVVVTHNLGVVRRMCSRVVVLSQGHMAFDGDTEGGIGVYHDLMDSRSGADLEDVDDEDDYVGGATVAAELVGPDGRPVATVTAGDEARLRVTAHFDDEVTGPVLGMAVAAGRYSDVYMTFTTPGEYEGTHGPDAPLVADIVLQTPLLEGTYQARVHLHDATGTRVMARARPCSFYVSARHPLRRRGRPRGPGRGRRPHRVGPSGRWIASEPTRPDRPEDRTRVQRAISASRSSRRPVQAATSKRSTHSTPAAPSRAARSGSRST